MVMTRQNTSALLKEEKRTGFEIALETTLKIAELLPNKDKKALFKKAVGSIFDDQLKSLTKLNRNQRHIAIKKLKKELDRRLDA